MDCNENIIQGIYNLDFCMFYRDLPDNVIMNKYIILQFTLIIYKLYLVCHIRTYDVIKS